MKERNWPGQIAASKKWWQSNDDADVSVSLLDAAMVEVVVAAAVTVTHTWSQSMMVSGDGKGR